MFRFCRKHFLLVILRPSITNPPPSQKKLSLKPCSARGYQQILSWGTPNSSTFTTCYRFNPFKTSWKYFTFNQMFPDFRKSTDFWRAPWLRPLVLLVTATRRWRWWNVTNRGTPKYPDKNLPHFHFLHHNSHRDQPAMEPGPPWWQIVDQQPEP